MARQRLVRAEHGFVEGGAGADTAREIGEGDTEVAVRVLVDQRGVMKLFCRHAQVFYDRSAIQSTRARSAILSLYKSPHNARLFAAAPESISYRRDIRGQDMEDVSLTHAKDHLEELIERAANRRGDCISDLQSSAPVQATARCPVRPSQVPNGDRAAGRAGSPRYPERLFEPLSDEEQAPWLSGERSK